jgi:galactonate dehydratase
MNKKNTFSRRSFISKGAAAGALIASNPISRFGEHFEKSIENNANLSSRPSDLEITDMQCGFIRGGSHLFVKIHTNQGIYGCGEGADAVPDQYHLAHRFGRQIRGRNPLDVHRLFEEIRRAGFFRGAQSGIYIGVLSAIEQALWDIAGKALDVPVYQLLGGKFRDRVRVYMDTALYQSQLPEPQEFAQSALEAVELGMTAIKFDLDQANDPNRYDRYNWTASPAEIQRMYDQMAAAREAVGPNIDICADMHGRYDLPTAKKVAKILEPLDLMWLEEPVPAENVDAYKLITDSTHTPICTGENLYLAHEFRRLFELGAVDIIMPDIQKCGGLGESQRIANLAHLYYIPFAPHMVSSYLGAMAACHVCASVPNFMILEWQIYFHNNPMYREIVHYDGNYIDDDGFITLSEKPGIGVDINEEGLARYRTERLPFDFG